MSPSKRFQPVQKLARSREQEAARNLGDIQRQMQAHASRLSELRNYHQEYLARFHAAAENGMSAAQLMEYRAFLAKLERAIAEQEQVLERSQIACSNSRDQWKAKHIRTQALGKVVDRMRREERKLEESREQKQQDERNQRRR